MTLESIYLAILPPIVTQTLASTALVLQQRVATITEGMNIKALTKEQQETVQGDLTAFAEAFELAQRDNMVKVVIEYAKAFYEGYQQSEGLEQHALSEEVQIESKHDLQSQLDALIKKRNAELRAERIDISDKLNFVDNGGEKGVGFDGAEKPKAYSSSQKPVKEHREYASAEEEILAEKRLKQKENPTA